MRYIKLVLVVAALAAAGFVGGATASLEIAPSGALACCGGK